MKKVIFFLLFSLILFEINSQTLSVNKWLLGKWIGTDNKGTKFELVLFDNGTGKWKEKDTQHDIYYAINNDLLTLYISTVNKVIDSFIIHRINDQKMFLIKGNFSSNSQNILSYDNIHIRMEKPPVPPPVYNWLSVSFNILIGVGVRYECMINDYFSLSGNAHYQVAIADMAIDFFTRVYPFGKILYIGLGLGYHPHAFVISPEIGVKLDFGQKGSFFLDIGYKNPFYIGDDNRILPVPHIGFGWAF